MTGEILCVGTELLLGDIINTNAAFLAREPAVRRASACIIRRWWGTTETGFVRR